MKNWSLALIETLEMLVKLIQDQVDVVWRLYRSDGEYTKTNANYKDGKNGEKEIDLIGFKPLIVINRQSTGTDIRTRGGNVWIEYFQ